MKTVQHIENENLLRLSDEEAFILVTKDKHWKYVPKKVWKTKK